MANKLVSRPPRKKSTDIDLPAKAAAPAVSISIDYPKEEELVLTGHYAVRISSSASDAQVEVAINNGDWNGCRASAEFFYFDWMPSDLGETVIKARVRSGTGKWKVSSERFCRVVNSKKA